MTLYTAQPGTEGIALSTEAQVRDRATFLSRAAAEPLLRHLPHQVGP